MLTQRRQSKPKANIQGGADLFAQLPEELLVMIFNFVSDSDHRTLASVSTKLYEFVSLHYLNTLYGQLSRFKKWQSQEIININTNFEVFKSNHQISLFHHPRDLNNRCLGLSRKLHYLWYIVLFILINFYMLECIKNQNLSGTLACAGIDGLIGLIFCLGVSIAKDDNSSYQVKPINEIYFQDLTRFLSSADGFVPDNALAQILHPIDIIHFNMMNAAFPQMFIIHTTVNEAFTSLENIINQINSNKIEMDDFVKSCRLTLKRSIEDLEFKSSNLRDYAIRTFSMWQRLQSDNKPQYTSYITDVSIDINVNKKTS